MCWFQRIFEWLRDGPAIRNVGRHMREQAGYDMREVESGEALGFVVLFGSNKFPPGWSTRLSDLLIMPKYSQPEQVSQQVFPIQLFLNSCKLSAFQPQFD